MLVLAKIVAGGGHHGGTLGSRSAENPAGSSGRSAAKTFRPRSCQRRGLLDLL